ncbi:AAA family ATPase [Streptomyces sp. V2I9]|uniref:AAA family ATPase n=1 Tax=Streptomyces sp. V2I9 TaxID=3042304 RepID=UPI0027886F3B|nr:AAA family ATPase [Streptomyces sp. V2I9]MDQ0988141.1 tetratricopeptide (TPR) repeat protein [Streptomyces sp. V2I9]
MNSLGTDSGGTAYNTVSGDAVIVGPVLMAQHIEGLRLPERAPDVPPSQGPPPSRVFVNRTKELAGLREAAVALAGEPGPGMLLVVGVGGVGKTQLVAQSVRRELKQLFPDGQLYVDLEDLRRDGAVDLAAVLGRFLRALGVSKDYVPAGLAECTALFRSVAAGKRLLVMVDNAQHAPEARALVPPGGLLVVIGRRVLPSLLMDGAVLIAVDPLDEAAGTELVRRWHADADEETAADVVRLCAGHPLALRAAVEWLAARPHLTLDDVVRDLTAAGRHGTDGGHTGTGGVGVREARAVVMGANEGLHEGEGGVGEAVDTVLDSVVAEVSEHTRQLYDLLGVLPGTTATTDLLRAAGAVRVDEALGELVSSRLAVLVESPDRPRRCRLHDVARAHARVRARALTEDGRRPVLRLVVDFYRDAAAHADALVLGDRFRIQPPPDRALAELSAKEPLFVGRSAALDWLDAERVNLEQVIRTAAEHAWYEDVWRLCESLWALYHSRKHLADCVATGRLGIEAAQHEARPDVEVRMRNQVARAAYELGDLDQADAELTAATALLGLTGDPRLSGVVWETRGLIALARDRADEARELFGRALEANRSVPDPHGVVVQSYNVGQALVAGGRWDDALGVLDAAAEVARTTGDDPMLPRIELVRARALCGRGELDRAVAAAVAAADGAAELRQLAKFDQALALLASLAERAEEEPLRAAYEEKLRTLRQAMGLKPPAAAD